MPFDNTAPHMSSPPAGWYADPEDATQLRYWDGSGWTEHRSPAQAAGPSASYAQYAPYTANVYDERADLGAILTAEQREQYKQHALTKFPTWLVVVLHFPTLGLFTLIYQGLKFSKLPQVKHDDFGAGKGIGFMFIPFFNIYWVFRFVLGMSDRLNFQFRLRGQRPPVSRGLALASAIVLLIPYVGIITWVFLMPIVAGQWQSATNRLAAERDAAAWAGFSAAPEARPVPPAQS
jgi:hypothetical protein